MKLCVIAEQASLGEDLAHALRGAGADVVVAEVPGPAELLATVAEQRPDVALLDLDLAVPESLGDAARLVEPLRALGLKVVVMVEPHEQARLLAAIEAGADGIVATGTTPEELVAAARQVMEGATLIGEAVRQEVRAEVHRQRSREEAEPQIHRQLSRREREALARQRQP